MGRGRARGVARLAAASLLLGGCGSGEADPPPHVVLISLDTLRADRLGCYGYERPTSPVLDALARESFLFEEARANSNQTHVSHMAMFTGLLPPVYSAPGKGDPVLPTEGGALAEVLRGAGYATVAFADGGYVLEEYGFDRGFERFFSRFERVDDKVDRVLDWLADAEERPTFLFFHTYGVHAPYLPGLDFDRFTDPDYDGPLRERVESQREHLETGGKGSLLQYRERFWDGRVDFTAEDTAYLSDLYDGCVRQVDSEVGRLLDALDERGWLDDAWVVVTSDHGEAFREHGSYEHRQLYEEELRVPLLIRPPGGLDEPRRDPRIVGIVDVAPTLLGRVGLAPPGPTQGVDLLDPDVARASVVHAFSFESPGSSAIGERYKLVTRLQDREVYDLDADPAEAVDLVEARDVPERAAELLESLSEVREESRALRELYGVDLDAEPELSPEQEKLLRALGYTR